MSAGIDDFTRKLLERTKARQEAMQQKMLEHSSAQSRKRRPLESQDNVNTSKQTELNVPMQEAPKTESPNKRSRMENAEDIENEKNVESNSAKEHGSNTGTVNERMKKILSQRKQWEAAEQGDEVDFTNCPSPVRHDPSSPLATSTLQRPIDVERKARMAALAQKVNSWEDDLKKSKISPEKPEKAKPKTSIGRKTPMVDAYAAEILAKEPSSSPTEESIRPVKNISKRVSLSIETLSQFAANKKPPKPPTDNAPQKLPVGAIQAKLGGNKITVSSYPDTVNKPQAGESSKSLQERLIELQRNGCQAEQQNASADNSLSGKQSVLSEESFQDGKESPVDTETCMAIANEHEPKVTEESFDDEPMTTEDISVSEADISNKTEEEEEEEEGQEFDDEDLDEAAEEAEESTASYGDSMMDDDILEQADVTDDVDEDSSTLDEDAALLQEEGIPSGEKDSGEDTMIDELFEFEDADLAPPRSTSPITIPSLTRQKSKMEIRSELSVRRQTCNEAEDMHSISRQPSRRLRPLARSNSTESVRSLGDEKKEGIQKQEDFPIFTIDAYRTEKRKSLRKTDQKVVRKESLKVKAKTQPQKSVQDQISGLLEEVQQQQRVIQQASAALNCCYDAQHGKGSITELEAEKLLLISSEKRLALLAAIQELKGQGRKKLTNGKSACSGTIKIDHLRLPLRTEYIFSMASKKDGGEAKGHYYFLLIRCGAQKIFTTHLASTHDSLSCDSLVFKDKFQLSNLESDFEIVIEVYSKNHKSRADGVPNQEKSKSKFSEMLQKSLTPRKTKSRSASLSHTASPGGPNAIRISSFTLIGSTSITLGDVSKDKFALQKVPFLSPISGQLACKITADFRSNIEQRGFLTMFDDVGGLGAWHRRWCALKCGVLYSWTYPDDEKNKTPLSKIALKECISDSIATVERIRCARPNTFELRTMRPRRHGDRDNLISQDTGSVITTKHWLAADTKEDRITWIDSLNQALSDVRAWDNDALKPLKRSQN